MARRVSASSARIAHTRGRGGTSQSEAGGRPASIQRETEGAEKEEKKRQEYGSEESDDEEGHRDDDDSESSTSRESETKEPTKPTAKTQATTDQNQDDVNERKEGTADEDDDYELFARKVEVRCKVCKKGECPQKGTTEEHRSERLASQMARAAGDFETHRNCERQAMFAQAYKTSVYRIFISLGLANDIVDAIVDEQG